MKNITIYNNESKYEGFEPSDTKTYKLWLNSQLLDFIKSVRIILFLENKTEIYESMNDLDIHHIANKIFVSSQTKAQCNHTFVMPYKNGIMFVNFFECKIGEYFDNYAILAL